MRRVVSVPIIMSVVMIMVVPMVLSVSIVMPMPMPMPVPVPVPVRAQVAKHLLRNYGTRALLVADVAQAMAKVLSPVITDIACHH